MEYEEPVGALVATETIATMPCLLYLPTKKGKKIAWAEKQNKIAFLFYFLVVAVYFFSRHFSLHSTHFLVSFVSRFISFSDFSLYGPSVCNSTTPSRSPQAHL